MEIKQSKTSEDISEDYVMLDALGKVSRNGLGPQNEPLADFFGESIYSKNVLLNLTSVKHIDSTGVEWLLSCHKRCEENGGRFVVHSPTPIVEQLLKMMRMHLVLNIAANEQAAKELLGNVHHGE